VTLLVVGGSGYLGGELCRQAVGAGTTVVATYLRAPGELPGVRWERLDITDGAAVDRLVSAVRPQTVVNAAYRSGHWASTATGAAYVAAASAGARLVHISSDAVHGGRPEPYDDEADPTPIQPYGAAKAAAETAVRALAPSAAVLRCSLIIGPDARSDQVRLCLEALAPDRDLRLFSDEIRTPVWVSDLAAAVHEVAAGDYAGLLNVSGPEALSRAELGTLVARAHGHDPSLLRTATVADSGLVRAARVVLDTSRARDLLKTHLRPPSEVLSAQAHARST